MRHFILFLLLGFCGQLFGNTLDTKWVRQFPGDQLDLGYGVDSDPAGNIYVTGYFTSSTLDLGSVVLTNSFPSGTNANAYVAKMNSAGTVLWARALSGTTESSSISVDSEGNSYIAGRYLSPTMQVGNITLTNAGTTLAIEIYAAKFDTHGNVLWANTAGGTGNDTGFAVAADDSGNCYVTGWFRDAPAKFGNITLQNSGSFNWFVAKYNSAGNVVWAKRSDGNGDVQSKGIAADRDGNVYVTGRYSGSVTFDSFSLNGAHYDFVLAKYDSNGAVVWVQSAGAANLDYGSSVAVDLNGNPHVTGYFESSTITFGSTTLTNAGAAVVAEIFTAKYDTAGNVLWAQSARGLADDEGRAIAVDRFGNACVTGFFNSSTLAAGSIVLTNRESSDVFFLKYDAFGNLMTAQSYGGTAGDSARGVSGDRNGDVLLTGLWAGTASFGGTNLTAVASSDAYVLKIGSEPPIGPSDAADFVWARKIGGPGNDAQGGIAADTAGNVYASGHFGPSSAFPSTNLVSRGDTDAYLAKYDPIGNFLWVRQIGGNGSDTASSVAVDHAGDIYVSGYFSGTATFDSTNITSFGAGDIFLAKYSSEGALLWVQRAGGTGADHSLNLSIDASNCVYMGGYYRGVSAFGPMTITADTSCSLPRSDAYIAKYFPNGEAAWVVGGGGCLDDVTYDVKTDSASVYSVGYYRTNSMFGETSVTHVGLQDAFIAKYDLEGSLQWIRTATGTGIDIAQQVCSDASGNVYATGYYESNALNFGSTNLSNLGGQDLFLAKYNVDGALLWVRRIGGTGNEGVGALLVDGAGDVWVAGTFQNTVSFGITNLTSKGAGDVFLARYNGNGVIESVKTWGSAGSDAASDLFHRADDEMYLAGVFSGSVSFGNDLLMSNGGTDSFIGMVTSNFMLTWPVLKVDLSGTTLLISWPASFENFVLQYSDLNFAWQNVPFGPVKIENRYFVGVEASDEKLFFRLKRP